MVASVQGRRKGPRRAMRVRLVAFGYKYGAPRDADLLFDVRALPNPFYVEELRPLSGLDAPVVAFLDALPECTEFFERLESAVGDLLEKSALAGTPQLTIGLGCTGGRHRSVYLVHRLGRRLAGRPNIEVEISARDLHRPAESQGA
ncbi:MAG: hypothetical protein JO101_13130 [Candidatus Eremiobacteraeota bacterium]|nr:hypothetical protein [Candidatus Eremiobacteraeota bacterium]MBV8356262.1 hypothetical protein [Candidatus Eremiobacteraeota bacterium]